MPVPVPRQRETPAEASGQAVLHTATGATGATATGGTGTTAIGTTATGATATGGTGTTAIGTTATGGTGTTAIGTTATGATGPGTTAIGTATAPATAPATPTATAIGTATATAPSAAPAPSGAPAPSSATAHTTPLTLLVIEDDPAGGLTVPEILDADGHRIRLRAARNLVEAERLLTPDVHCILLDLALPETGSRPGAATTATTTAATAAAPTAVDRLTTLRQVLRLAPRHAVLVLTSEADAERAAEAVRVGAQDFLFRDELDGRLLSRAIRYAVERKRADIAQYKLAESKLRAQENARLERGLLPTPLLEGSDLRFAARYRPGRSRALLGGDFYDVVRTPDGTVHAMIGDVCGHGPDEAALGVELRIAWRALTLAGLCGDDLLATLQEVLEVERPGDEIFATLCTVDIAPDGRRAGLCLAGHPAPLINRPGRPASLLPYENSGPALGLLPRARWPRRQVELGGTWSLMLYTDGLIEGRIGEGKERLGQDGMVEMINRHLDLGLSGEGLLEASVTEARRLNGGELTDDVAVVLLSRTEA